MTLTSFSTMNKDPCKAMFDENSRLNLYSQRPSKTDAPFVFEMLMQDLLWRAQFLTVRHVFDRCTETLRRKGRDSHRVKTFCLGFRTQL